MSDPNDGGGENGSGEGGHGFIPESWEPAIKKGESWFGNIADGVTGVDAGLRTVGALPYAQMLSKFAGGGVGETAKALWDNKGELFNTGTEAAEGTGLGKALGPIGVGMGAISAVSNGVELANDIKKDGLAGAYHDQEAYNHLGGATPGAAHTILPFLGPYGKAADFGLSVGEAGANLGGKAAGWAFGDDAKFSADSVAGGLIRGTFGDQSMGEGVRQSIGNTFGHGGVANAVGWGADVLTNTAMMPANLGMTVGRGLWNEGSAVVDSIANGKGAVGSALNTAGKWVGNEAKSIGTGALDMGRSALNTASNIGSQALDMGSSALHTAGDLGSKAISGVGNTVNKVLSW